EVLPRLNKYARVPVCGLVSQYNATSLPSGPDQLPRLMNAILIKSLLIRGFIQDEFWRDLRDDFHRDMPAWVREGQVTYREDIVDGLENAPAAFSEMLKGGNFGKLVIRVGTE